MIAPIAGLAVKGATFHQGYNNALGGGSAGAAMLDGETVEDGKLTRRQRSKIRAVLRQEDLRRRLAEARTLLREHGESETGPVKK